MSLRAAALVLGRRSNLGIHEGIASGEEHTCPGGRCQGERPRNDIVSPGVKELVFLRTLMIRGTSL
jgi:hypothetical protein